MNVVYRSLAIFLIAIFFVINNSGYSSAQSSVCLNDYTHYLTIGSTNASTNGEVSRLQAYLYSLGFLNTTPTGYFGELTRTAVAKYQISMKITPYGTIGPITRTALKLSCNITQNNIDTAQHFAPIDLDLGCIESPYDYKTGSRDNSLMGNITKLQTYLYQNSLMSYPPTGYFGQLTQTGLLKYQSLRGLPTTGNYDYPTRITIAKETCNGKSSLTPPFNYGSNPNTATNTNNS